MSITVSWSPNPPSDNVASYNLNSASSPSGPWTLVFNVPSTQSGAYWNSVTNQYNYVDSAGTLTTWYQLVAINSAMPPVDSASSSPFQPLSSSPSDNGQVMVNQDYGSAGALRYQTDSGIPIEGATILIFTLQNYQTGNVQQAVAVTTTDRHGNWVSPVFLTTGFTYVVEFFKQGMYGPNTTQIVV